MREFVYAALCVCVCVMYCFDIYGYSNLTRGVRQEPARRQEPIQSGNDNQGQQSQGFPRQ